jgi:UrcA family protein
MCASQTEDIMTGRFIKLLPLAAAFALTGVANASTVRELPSVVVKYGDLDLGTVEGVVTLHARLRRAAKDVCGQLDSRVLGLREYYAHCVSEAVTTSVARVGNPSLTSFHRLGRKPLPVAAIG